MKVENKDTVKIEYTGKLSDGTVFDSSEGREPLEFTVGERKVIPGFEEGVIGMELNESKTITIPAEKAYGERRDDLQKDVPRSALPQDQEPKEGMQLLMQTPDGHQIPATIAKVTEENVTLDLNHPLAGKDLTFDVKVVGIEKPSEESSAQEEKSEEEPAEKADEEGAQEAEKEGEQAGEESAQADSEESGSDAQEANSKALKEE